MKQIKNIILDLGGVIINLDIHKTINEFNKITKSPFESIYGQLKQTELFDLFDKGLISETVFFDELRKNITTRAENDQLINAWNAMLLDFPAYRLNFLKTLQPKFRLFLLSNTNETHIKEFEKQLYVNYGFKNLEPFFEKVYYSCRMGMRKPDEEIFNWVLNENGLTANETIFIDDTIHHVNGALNTGIQAFLLDKNKEIEQLLLEKEII